MSKHNKSHATQPKAEEDALKIARGTQRPGQTKEQTKLIAQGIKKGIELYQKQQNVLARELDKQRKRELKKQPDDVVPDVQIQQVVMYKQHWLPWLLLALSWSGFAGYLTLV